MNKGILPGLNPDGWRTFRPTLATAGAGGEVQPVLDIIDGSYQIGRVNIVDHALALVQMQMAFVGTFSVGSGAAYVLRLPFPAQRALGAIDRRPIGVGMCYFSFANPAVNLPVIVTLADPFASLNGTEDSYIQCMVPYIISWGTGTFVSGSATVTHRCGYAPAAEDIRVVQQQAPSGGQKPIVVTNITATTFDVVTNNANGVSFAWKVRGKPPTGQTGGLMSPTAPFDWSRSTIISPFGNMFLQMKYEPRL